ncbi:MFS transporter [Deinococcus apachensis]|uniref:MFS transporter n=1 Tax=Deinococcus apachensis TaxID=309886 RepID=UPI000366AACB|nr:MFS transporter [Deinococcus apachensis]
MTAAWTSRPLSRSFLAYWSALSAGALGDAAVSVAVPFLALAVGGGAASVGAVVLAGSLPRFLGPLYGLLADRHSPRLLLTLCSVVRGLGITLVGLLAFHLHVPLFALCLLAFLNGALATLTFTTGAALLPQLVPEHDLPRANSLLSAALMGAPLIGYGVGGGLVKLLGSGGTLLLAVPFILALAAATPLLPLRRNHPGQPGRRQGALQDILTGLRLCLSHPVLRAVMLLSGLMNLALNVVNVRAPLAMTALGRGAPDYAVFEMLVALGALAGIAMVTPLSRRLGTDALINLGRLLVVPGLTLLAAAHLQGWWVGGAVLGLSLGLLEVAGMTRLQRTIPEEVRGRALGALLTSNAAGLSLGAALAGLNVPSTWLMPGLAVTLLLLGFVWPLAVRSSLRE